MVFENLYMPLFIKDGKLHVYISNDLSKDINAQISIKFLSFEDGKEISNKKEIKVELKADQTKEVYSQEISKDNAQNYFIYAFMKAEDALGKEYYSENTLFPLVYKHCNIQKSKIECKINHIIYERCKELYSYLKDILEEES